MHSQESGPRGVEIRPPSFFSLAFAVGIICFPVGVQPPTNPRLFLLWSPYRKGDMEDIEKVQKMATKLIPELNHMNYIDRLKKCQLPTLRYRRIRGDMIETYKIVSGKYDSMAAPMIPGSHSYITRGHDLRLHKSRAKYDLRKYFFFSNKVVNVWNSLPGHVVNVDTVNCFKTRLD